MKVAILSDEKIMASVAADTVEAVCTANPHAVLGLATGSSPLALYRELIERHRAGRIDFAQSRSFNLDEYVGLPAGHPESYIEFIRRNFTDLVDLPAAEVHVPEGNASDPHAAAAAYDRAIRDADGIDIQVLGIGSDGHIGFNEPGGSLASRTHVGFLTEQTRRDNARFFDGDVEKVPTHCITQGLGTIMESRHAVLLATGENKAEAVHQLVEGGISARWPATVLQSHPDLLVVLDEAAASQLELADFYREVWSEETRTR